MLAGAVLALTVCAVLWGLGGFALCLAVLMIGLGFYLEPQEPVEIRPPARQRGTRLPPG
jgi:hypothetical protein